MRSPTSRLAIAGAVASMALVAVPVAAVQGGAGSDAAIATAAATVQDAASATAAPADASTSAAAAEPEAPGTTAHDGEDHAARPQQKPRAQGAPTAGPPTDYRKVKGLSQPTFETVEESYRVPVGDGEELYVEITRPKASGKFPVIMEISPYHGTIADREGIRIFPDPTDAEGNPIGLTGYFAPRGYAVAMVDLRGTGSSSGCLDHLGPNDAADMKTVIEWAAAQPWSNGRVGLTGHSYVGSTPSVAAAQKPEGLVTIAPSAGLASMYDHQFHHGVPYYFQWAGPQWAYEALAMGADMPPIMYDPVFGYQWGDNWEDHSADETGCGWQNSALTAGHGQVTGQYQDWHADRDWRGGATDAEIPVFMIHGVNDNAARIAAAEWFFGNRFDRDGDKVWLGQWDHGSAGFTSCEEADPDLGHVNCRFEQWQYALHAWFDKHLQQRNVDTGAPVEVFLNGDQVLTDDAWSEPAAVASLFPDARDGSLRLTRPDGDASASFTAYATGLSTRGSSLEFVSEPFDRDLVVVGLPSLRLHAATSSPHGTNLVTVLERVTTTTDDEGNEVEERQPMNYCAMNTHLREGVDEPSPVAPGAEMELRPQCFTMAHHVRKGDKLVFSVRTTSPHHVSTFSEDVRVTVFTGPEDTQYALPKVARPVLFDDVPLRDVPPPPEGPAQEGISQTVFTGAPGTYVHGSFTTASVEFDVLSEDKGYGNASLEALAVPSAAADLDLYLLRQEDDGDWTELAAGESDSTSEESLALEWPDLEPGHYRLDVHNWLGPPANPTEVTITFFDADGNAGPDPA